MSTVTAHVLIGKAHSLHGGISPTHVIYLNENFRPVLTLLNQNLPPRQGRFADPIVWIPSLENMMDDLMLMANLFVIRDKDLRKAAPPVLRRHGIDPAWIYEVQEEYAMGPLYALSRQIHTGCKIQLCVSRESTLYRQLTVLDQYDVDVEIYTSAYRRELSAWDGEVHTHGEIPSEV